jgi:hypothetical protein
LDDGRFLARAVITKLDGQRLGNAEVFADLNWENCRNRIQLAKLDEMSSVVNVASKTYLADGTGSGPPTSS